MRAPLCIDLFCGLGGFSEGAISEGYFCVGFDIERHVYGEHRYPAQLVIQDVLTLHGSQFKDAALIVCSPPCQFFSYCAMPWSRAKALAAKVRADPALLEKELALFRACFRIQREACDADERHIPMVVENVRGAIPWVGRSRWNFGSYHLWGDVPALMPPTVKAQKFNPDGTNHGQGSWFAVADSKDRGSKNGGGSWFIPPAGRRCEAKNNPDGRKLAGFRFDGSGRSFQSASVTATAEGRKGAGAGAEWFDQNLCQLPSKSPRRKAASAMIAKIPEPLARWIARCFLPRESEAA